VTPPAVAPPPPPPRKHKKRVKQKRVKRGVLGARYVLVAPRPSEKLRWRPPAPTVDAGAAASGVASTSSTSSGTILVALLLAASLLLIATAAVPSSALPPSRVGSLIANHRPDLVTAGATGVVCLLFALFISRVG
jgi:hypothetical protein